MTINQAKEFIKILNTSDKYLWDTKLKTFVPGATLVI